jgi:hypothetical protein
MAEVAEAEKVGARTLIWPHSDMDRLNYNLPSRALCTIPERKRPEERIAGPKMAASLKPPTAVKMCC